LYAFVSNNAVNRWDYLGMDSSAVINGLMLEGAPQVTTDTDDDYNAYAGGSRDPNGSDGISNADYSEGTAGEQAYAQAQAQEVINGLENLGNAEVAAATDALAASADQMVDQDMAADASSLDASASAELEASADASIPDSLAAVDAQVDSGIAAVAAQDPESSGSGADSPPVAGGSSDSDNATVTVGPFISPATDEEVPPPNEEPPESSAETAAYANLAAVDNQTAQDTQAYNNQLLSNANEPLQSAAAVGAVTDTAIKVGTVIYAGTVAAPLVSLAAPAAASAATNVYYGAGAFLTTSSAAQTGAIAFAGLATASAPEGADELLNEGIENLFGPTVAQQINLGGILLQTATTLQERSENTGSNKNVNP
jgi:hypothetical protein